MTRARFPAALEHRLIRAVCGLPAPVQRALFGRPPRLDGQVLAPDLHALLRLARMFGQRSLAGEGSPAAARAARRRDAAATRARPPLPLAATATLGIPGMAGTIAARHYVPPGLPSAGAPLLLYLHGGGWVVGDLDTHDGVCRFLAREAGVAVLSVDYRLAPEHRFPAALEDAWAALAWTLANATGLGADPTRIAVGGDSAGGTLATTLCLLAREAGWRVAMQLLLYPVVDAAAGQRSRRLFAEGFTLSSADMAWFEGQYAPHPAERADPRYAPLRAADLAGLPPAYVAVAGFDPLRDEGLAYAERLRQAGVPTALRLHPELPHTFANLTAICPSAHAAMLEAAGALRMALASPAVPEAT